MQGVVKSIQLCVSKIENVVVTDPLAFDVSGLRNNQQKYNGSLLALLEQLRRCEF
jgi:hypothetical protein